MSRENEIAFDTFDPALTYALTAQVSANSPLDLPPIDASSPHGSQHEKEHLAEELASLIPLGRGNDHAA
jgi:hypothetical protein